MKDVTIITFDEMERIRHDIDNMIENAQDGAWGTINSKDACTWIIDELKELRELFE